MLDEHNIIKTLQKAFPHLSADIIGIGDDGAVIPLNERESYVVTKDLLVEDNHFRLAYFDAESLAHKALHVNLSDVAAMAAKPRFVLLGVSIPRDFKEDYLKQFLNDFGRLCLENDVQLIGGDTTASGDEFVISVTVIGQGMTQHLKFRRGARIGDIIAVAGNLGHAHLGLKALEGAFPGLEEFKMAALRPMARVREGLWMGQQKDIHTLMDLSDGLVLDLSRLSEASQVCAEIEINNLTPSKEFLQGCAKVGQDPLECMLVGGEDYGLLMTVTASAYDKIAKDFEQSFGYSLMRVGIISAGQGLRLKKDGEEVIFKYKLFSHFGEI